MQVLAFLMLGLVSDVDAIVRSGMVAGRGVARRTGRRTARRTNRRFDTHRDDHVIHYDRAVR